MKLLECSTHWVALRYITSRFHVTRVIDDDVFSYIQWLSRSFFPVLSPFQYLHADVALLLLDNNDNNEKFRLQQSHGASAELL